MTQENADKKEEVRNEIVNAPSNFRFMLAEKIGMTQIYNKEGELEGVTVLKAGPCKVVYVRTKEVDGYNAVCLGFENIKESKVNKPLKGIFDKYNLKPFKYLKEFRVESVEGFAPGQIVSLEGRYKDEDWIDVQGITIGKGFAGGMKRHNFSGQPASHGASDRERAPGGLASRRALGRVLPGQRMAGHLGVEKVTVHKIQIVKTIPQQNLILVNGSVPGKEGNIVAIHPTVKSVPKKSVVPTTKAKGKKEAPKQQAKPAKKK